MWPRSCCRFYEYHEMHLLTLIQNGVDAHIQKMASDKNKERRGRERKTIVRQRYKHIRTAELKRPDRKRRQTKKLQKKKRFIFFNLLTKTT